MSRAIIFSSSAISFASAADGTAVFARASLQMIRGTSSSRTGEVVVVGVEDVIFTVVGFLSIWDPFAVLV